MKKLLLSSAILATFAQFTACGDDVTEVTEVHQDGMAVLDAGLELSKQKCDTSNVGEMLFVADSSEVFVCDGKTWQTLKGADGKPGENGDNGNDGTSCTASVNKDGDFDLVCGGKSVGTIKNGANGKDGLPGADGDNGNDGESCTAEPVTNSAGLKGLEVTCGKTVVGTIWNGEKGEPGTDGEDGDDGVGCSVKDEGDGTVTVTCGDADPVILIKAVCDMEPYDPAKSFCSAGEVYELCDGKTYDPTKSFCSEGEVYELCDGKTYDPAKSFCSGGEVYELCDGKTFDPAKSFCSDGKLYSCNDEPYDPTKSFCSAGEVYELCDGKTYDPKEQYCLKVTRGETDIYSVEALLTDARDNQVYKTVEICNEVESSCQTWMAQNLNYSVNPGKQSWCYRDSAEYCEKYGRLYTWAAAIDSVALANDSENSQTCGYDKTCTLPAVVQGVCPSGWHLPSYDEWETLFSAVGGSSKAGTALKSQTGWYSQTGDAADRDAYGFSALPAGVRNNGGVYDNASSAANFWSASQNEDNSIRAYFVFLSFYNESANMIDLEKNYGRSVRCLKD